jgi:hypothetical protein
MKAKKLIDTPLEVVIEKNQLVIRIGLNTLAWCAEYCPRFYDGYNDPTNDGPYEKIVDKRELARDIKRALLHEQEDGTTPLCLLLDDAIEWAANDGSLAFEERNV